MINYIAEDVKLPGISKLKVNRWIRETAAGYGYKVGEIAYVFCSDEKILEVNRQYLQHDYYTDIITFDYTEGRIISGDIFISVDTVADNARELNITFDDELLRILIHGILHLCGQDDKTPELRQEMTRKENEALKNYSNEA